MYMFCFWTNLCSTHLEHDNLSNAMNQWKTQPHFRCSPRQHGGVRLTWGNDEETTFGQRWNPWCTTLPYMTIAHHPILYNPKEHDTVIYNVDDFFETVLDAVEKAQRRSNSTLSVSLVEQPILIENYGSVMSVIYNQSWLGYNRDRNGVSFWFVGGRTFAMQRHSIIMYDNIYFGLSYVWLLIAYSNFNRIAFTFRINPMDVRK